MTALSPSGLGAVQAAQAPRRIAFVTGAGRGIGAATALALAQAGIEPVLAVRDGQSAQAIADAVRRQGLTGMVVPCDVGDGAGVRDAITRCLERFGRLDIVVNNAGMIEPIGHIADIDGEQWTRAIAVNLTGPFHVLQASLPALARSRGTVVNVSTGAAHRPREGWSAYCCSKAGLAMLTRCVHHEYGADVAAYGFMPGLVDTGMQATIRASGMNEISQVPKEKLPPPDDAVRMIAWLASERPLELRGLEVDLADPALRARALESATGQRGTGVRPS